MERNNVSLCCLMMALGFGVLAYAEQGAQQGVQQGTTYSLKSTGQNGTISFTAVGNPAFISIEGKGKGTDGELSIQDKIAKGTFKFNLETLDTGIDERNEHMKKKYLKTSDFPEATLNVTQLELAKPYNPQEGLGNGTFVGKLTLKGITHDIDGRFESKKQKDGKEAISAFFNLKLSDYQIEIPSFAGITVADKVDVEVNTALESPGAVPAR